jgi:hypothetical protein
MTPCITMHLILIFQKCESRRISKFEKFVPVLINVKRKVAILGYRET